MTYPLARNRVIPQPLGVVGVIVPWNFPLNLSFCPAQRFWPLAIERWSKCPRT
ncbi:aldehyde dehydrogenase family protein [Bradyrhizobium sp. USDA 4011]